MNFGQAIEALKQGKAVQRQEWNGKGLFVIKQVPAHITGEIIPGMQSLPDSAKKTSNGTGEPSYRLCKPDVNHTSR